MEAAMPALIPAQRLAGVWANHALRYDLEGFRHNNKVLSDHLKPWVDESLKISQDLDVVVKQLNQTLESVTTTTEGPTSQKLVEFAQNASAQSEGVFPPLVDAIKQIQAKMQAPWLLWLETSHKIVLWACWNGVP